MYSIFPFVLPKTTWLNTYLAHISTVLDIVSSQKVPEDAIWMSYANTLLLIFICFQGAGDRVWSPTHGNSTCKAPPTLLFYRRLGILRCSTTNLPCVKRDPCMPRGTAFSATVRSRQSPPLSSLPHPPTLSRLGEAMMSSKAHKIIRMQDLGILMLKSFSARISSSFLQCV